LKNSPALVLTTQRLRGQRLSIPLLFRNARRRALESFAPARDAAGPTVLVSHNNITARADFPFPAALVQATPGRRPLRQRRSHANRADSDVISDRSFYHPGLQFSDGCAAARR
jgi:hypothetical protein